MTEYERGYAEGYKDGLHRFMPEAPSVPIPPIDAAIAEEHAKPEDDARDLALDLASGIWEPNTLYVGARNQWLVSASLKIEAFAAERERKLAKRCADAVLDAILDFGKGDAVSHWYSPMIRKEMAAQLAERAIMRAAGSQDHAEPAKPEPGDVVPRVCGNCTHGMSTSLDDIRCYRATPYLPTGLHCLACEDWEPCGTHYNPRVEYLRCKIEEAGK